MHARAYVYAHMCARMHAYGRRTAGRRTAGRRTEGATEGATEGEKAKKGNRSDTTIYCIVRHIKHHYILYAVYLACKGARIVCIFTLTLYCPRNFARFAVFHMVDFFPYLTMSNPGGPVTIFDMFFRQ